MKHFMKNNKIYIICFCALVMLCLWGMRVYHVNSATHIEEKTYYLNDTIQYDIWTLRMTGYEWYDTQEFRQKIYPDYQPYQPSDQILCMCLEVSVDQGQNTRCNWDLFIENGFRTQTWYQGIDPDIFSYMNQKSFRAMAENGTCTIRIPVCIPVDVVDSNTTYDYVLSTFPKVVMIHMEIGKDKDAL